MGADVMNALPMSLCGSHTGNGTPSNIGAACDVATPATVAANTHRAAMSATQGARISRHRSSVFRTRAGPGCGRGDPPVSRISPGPGARTRCHAPGSSGFLFKQTLSLCFGPQGEENVRTKGRPAPLQHPGPGGDSRNGRFVGPVAGGSEVTLSGPGPRALAPRGGHAGDRGLLPLRKTTPRPPDVTSMPDCRGAQRPGIAHRQASRGRCQAGAPPDNPTPRAGNPNGEAGEVARRRNGSAADGRGGGAAGPPGGAPPAQARAAVAARASTPSSCAPNARRWSARCASGCGRPIVATCEGASR